MSVYVYNSGEFLVLCHEYINRALSSPVITHDH